MLSLVLEASGLCRLALLALVSLSLLVNAAHLDADTTSTSAGSNRIFNSVHDSMRQFGSSINHESRCAFIATVLAGVKLYHGTSKEEPPRQGLKWLAFEPEHAMLFSHPSEHWSTTFEKTGVDDHMSEAEEGHHEPDTVVEKDDVDLDQISMALNQNQDERLDDLLSPPRKKQKRETPSTPSIWQNFLDHDGWGYLHTYTTTRPLRLLYLDGTSAAKTTLGTLDLQDRVILQDRFAFSTNLDDDNVRAAELCRVAREDWEGRVDGFLRMETGFEIIMCDVGEAGLESRREDTVATQKIKDTFATYKALAQRFNGIGGGRVSLDYDRFVTVHGVKAENLSDVKAEIDVLVMEDGIDREEGSVNWQAVTDMVIRRFAAPLNILSSAAEDWDSKEAFDSEAGRLLLPFIDHQKRNRTMEVTRCAAYFLPGHTSHDSLALSSVTHISQTICHELLAAVEDDRHLAQAVGRMQELVAYLDWSIWKDCASACQGREVCYVPVWPFSLALDRRRQPECVDEARFYALAAEEIFAASMARKMDAVNV